DTERCGLNLGEVAATMIFQYKVESRKYKVGEHQPKTGTPNFLLSTNDFLLINGAIRNDATHISAPSRVGEGSFRALNYLITQYSLLDTDIAFVNAHGTATPYNDSMEAQAIFRAGLQNVPVNSLKPYFGHTLGAAGVLESIISIKALQDNIILPTLNFKSQNFENQLNISTEIQQTDKRYFIKMLSGFGGVNTVLLFEKIDY
ncbi:MAG: 3-oxoacyl-ACP synthase, partial [Paludibacter sp.]|nr:3-oxoacyl-ACP synthase [Paludibacter sp.]